MGIIAVNVVIDLNSGRERAFVVTVPVTISVCRGRRFTLVAPAATGCVAKGGASDRCERRPCE